MSKSKAKSNSKKKVNLNNAKISSVINHILISEGRISRKDILRIANKEALYALKNGNYIKETSKGHYTSTKKLRTYAKNTIGKRISSSCSSEHSAKIMESLKLIPNDVISSRSFNTSYDIESRFNNTIRKSYDYSSFINSKCKELQAKLDNLDAKHKANMIEEVTSEQRYQENISYLRERESISSELSLWSSSKPYLIPDYEATFTHAQLQEYIDNLREYQNSVVEDEVKFFMCSEAIDTLSSLSFEDTIVISFEITTNHYHERELTLHKNFALLTPGTTQIFL